MTYGIVLGIYIAALSLIGIISRRSLGIPMLGLAAGATLARLWTDSLTPFVAEAGFALVSPPLSSIVAVVLTIVPALLLTMRAPKSKSLFHSIIPAIMFAALAAMLTYPAFEGAVVLDDASRGIATQLNEYSRFIITGGIVFALFDVLVHRKKHPFDEKKKHK